MAISRVWLFWCFLAFLLSSCSVRASSMIEDQWLHVKLTSDRGDVVTLNSDGERFTRLEFVIHGRNIELDAAVVRDVGGPDLASIKVLVDSNQDGDSVRHFIIPFAMWRGGGKTIWSSLSL